MNDIEDSVLISHMYKTLYKLFKPTDWELDEEWRTSVSPINLFGQLEPVDMEDAYVYYRCGWKPKNTL